MTTGDDPLRSCRRVASITKTVGASGRVHLAEEGEVYRTDPLRDHAHGVPIEEATRRSAVHCGIHEHAEER